MASHTLISEEQVKYFMSSHLTEISSWKSLPAPWFGPSTLADDLLTVVGHLLSHKMGPFRWPILWGTYRGINGHIHGRQQIFLVPVHHLLTAPCFRGRLHIKAVYLNGPVLFGQLHLLLQCQQVPDLDGAVPEAANDWVATNLGVVDVVGTLERRLMAPVSS